MGATGGGARRAAGAGAGAEEGLTGKRDGSRRAAAIRSCEWLECSSQDDILDGEASLDAETKRAATCSGEEDAVQCAPAACVARCEAANVPRRVEERPPRR